MTELTVEIQGKLDDSGLSRFRVINFMASGTFGGVYRARDDEDEEGVEVAMKLLRDPLTGSERRNDRSPD